MQSRWRFLNVRDGSSASRLAQAGAIGVAGAAVSALLGWLRAKGLALALGPSGIGLYGQVWAFVLFASSFASLGIGVGTTALVALHRERRETDDLGDVARTSLTLPAVASVSLAFAVAGSAALVAPLVLARHAPWLVVIGAASIPFAALQLPLQHVLQGFEDAIGQNVVYVLYGIAFTAAAVVGAFLGGVYGAVLGLALGNVVLVFLYATRTRSLLRGARVSLSRAKSTRKAMKALVGVGIASLSMAVIYGVADLAVRTELLHAWGASVAGYWFALLTISVQFIGTLAGAMSYFTAPLAARAYAEENLTAVQEVLDASLRLAVIVIMPALVLLVATRHLIIGILFSDAFGPVAHVLPIQAAGDAVRTVGWTLGVALVPLGMTRAWFMIGAAASLLFGAIGTLFAARWGLTGSAVAWTLTWIVSSSLTCWALLHGGLWRPSARTLAGLAITVVALGVATAAPGPIGIGVALISLAGMAAAVTRPAERKAVVRRLSLSPRS